MQDGEARTEREMPSISLTLAVNYLPAVEVMLKVAVSSRLALVVESEVLGLLSIQCTPLDTICGGVSDCRNNASLEALPWLLPTHYCSQGQYVVGLSTTTGAPSSADRSHRSLGKDQGNTFLFGLLSIMSLIMMLPGEHLPFFMATRYSTHCC